MSFHQNTEKGTILEVQTTNEFGPSNTTKDQMQINLSRI